jgi:hypothetical protein
MTRVAAVAGRDYTPGVPDPDREGVLSCLYPS